MHKAQGISRSAEYLRRLWTAGGTGPGPPELGELGPDFSSQHGRTLLSGGSICSERRGLSHSSQGGGTVSIVSLLRLLRSALEIGELRKKVLGQLAIYGSSVAKAVPGLGLITDDGHERTQLPKGPGSVGAGLGTALIGLGQFDYLAGSLVGS